MANRKATVLQVRPSVHRIIPLKSDVVRSVAYDFHNKILLVQMKGGGSYRYDKFGEWAFAKMLTSPSIGKYYNGRVKGRYPCRRLEIEKIAEFVVREK